METRPTDDAYSELQAAYDFFNKRLFSGELPAVLLTLQRQRNSKGYFSAERFGRRDGKHSHELAVNPVYFAITPLEDVLSTLAHEQVHIWQYERGKPGRRGYHNREFGRMMKTIGLCPSSTGKPGGKQTGESMDHYIIEGGAFQQAAADLMQRDFVLSWYDRFPPIEARPMKAPSDHDGDDAGEDEADQAEDVAADLVAGEPNRSNRVKYSCAGCKANVWGKPGLAIKCMPCDQALAPVG